MRSLALVVALALVPGCRTWSERSLPGASGAALAVAQPVRAWELVQETRVVGVVVEFAEAEGRSFYSVRNAWQQELGLVDGVGRAWRYRPHEEEADWLGSGTVAEGAARVLGLEGPAEVYEVALDSLRDEEPATARAER